MALDVIYTVLTGHASLLTYGLALAFMSIVLVTVRLSKRRGNLFSKPNSTSITQPQTYVLQFPPSRRHTLAEIPGTKDKSIPSDLSPELLKSKAFPTTRSPDPNQDHQFTPTGFSTQEVRALGRLPDYSILSGVRHPEPCGPKFDINKAVFRPFRPFRWGYHQTMCMLQVTASPPLYQANRFSM